MIVIPQIYINGAADGFFMEKVSILIVEDEFIIAKDMEKTLMKLGYNVTDIVMSGEECLEKIEVMKPDLVLMDIKLGGKMDGIETSSVIQDRYDIPVIYLTAHSDTSSLERAKITRPYGYIVKPVNDRDLFTCIEMSIVRSRADKIVRKSESKFRLLFEQSSDPIYLRNSQGTITEANQAMINLFGYTCDELVGMNVRDLLVEPGSFNILADAIEKKGSVRNLELSMKKKDGTVIICLVNSKVFYDELQGYSGSQVILRDITEEKKNIELVTRTREELRYLSAHLQSLRERERSYIAREIHDVLGQLLTALKMDCTWLMKKIPDESPDVADRKESVLRLCDNTIDEVGRLSTELRPGLLYDLGLCEAVEWQAGEFMKRTGISCNLNCDLDGLNLLRDQSVALFRIFQESLTNIIRHADATEVNISLEKKGENIELAVHDNGKGITLDRIKDIRSYGLIGMRERAYSCSGEISITAPVEGGTRILVTIPVRPPQELYI